MLHPSSLMMMETQRLFPLSEEVFTVNTLTKLNKNGVEKIRRSALKYGAENVDFSFLPYKVQFGDVYVFLNTYTNGDVRASLWLDTARKNILLTDMKKYLKTSFDEDVENAQLFVAELSTKFKRKDKKQCQSSIKNT